MNRLTENIFDIFRAMFGSYQMLINGIDFDIKQGKWYAEENDNKNPKQMRIIQSDSEYESVIK